MLQLLFFPIKKATLILGLVSILLLLGTKVQAQSPSPGGVNANLKAWYKGEDVTANATNQNTNNWPSAMNNTYAFYRTNNWFDIKKSIHTNEEPYLNLNDEYFETNLDINDGSTFNELHVFTVYKPNSTNDVPIWGNGKDTDPQRGRQVSSQTITCGDNRSLESYNHNGSVKNRKDSAYIHHVNVEESSNSYIYINGKQQHQFMMAKSIESPSNRGKIHTKLIFGNKNIGNDQSADIQLAEFIVYSGTLNPQEREKINSYLAIKYGIPIYHNYLLSDDTIAWDYSNATYNENIVGVAYDKDARSNGTLSKNESVCQRKGDYLTLFASPGQYLTGNKKSLVVGHNGDSTNATTPFDLGDKFYDNGERMNRIWRAQQRGGYDKYTLSFNKGIPLPTGFTSGNMVLLVADSANFRGNVQVYPLEYTNDKYQATGINFGISASSTKFFTIAVLETSMWVKADARNNKIINSQVDTLKDQGLAGNDLEGVTMPSSSDKPLLQNSTSNSSVMNFHPYVTLNQGNQRNYLRKVNYLGFGRQESSVFMVTRNDSTGGTGQFFLSYATTDPSNTTRVNGNDLFLANPQNVRAGIGVSHTSTAAFSGLNLITIGNNLPALLSNEQGKNTDNTIGVNGVLKHQLYANNQKIHSSGTLIIGQEQDTMNHPSSYAINQQLKGDVAELIVCSQRVPSTKANRIRSYLAIKYGIFLAHTHNYEDSRGNLLWNRSQTSGPNQKYQRNVAGIGRDDAFDLDQRKSRSQKQDAVVTIEHLGSFTSDRDFLLWGSLLYKPGAGTAIANYDNITSTDAPQGFTISERRWKVSNPGNRVGQVKVYMDIPPSMQNNLVGVRLLVSGNTSFNAGFITAVQPSNVSSTQIEFAVTLKDGQYFSLGFDQDLSFTNNETGAPSTFEACAGDNVTFRYKDLTEHPVKVQFKKKGGGVEDVLSASITFSNQTNQNSSFGGEMKFNIPIASITGNVIFLGASGNVIYNSNAFITIHNPDLFIVPGTNPICATDTIQLHGFPSGGTFLGSTSNLVKGDSLYGIAAGWSANHDISKTVEVTYTHFSKYSNGNNCPNSKKIVKNITIRDNRLSSLKFATIVKSANLTNTKRLGVNSNTIVSTSPNILPPNQFPHPYTFTGTYVKPSHDFLADDALSSNPVNFRFNNQGCIAEITSDIDVFDPLSIPGIPDTLCAEADTFTFSRDSTLKYSRTISGITTIDSNVIAEVTTLDSNHRKAILVLNASLGNEKYAFAADSLPDSTTNVFVKITYIIIKYTGNTKDTTLARNAIANIVITPKPTVDIGTLDSVYCTTGQPHTLRPSPAFDHVSTTYFTLKGMDSLRRYTLTDTLDQDTIFSPSMHYDSLVSPPTRDLPVRLTYTVDRYGCTDHATAFTVIRAPLRPFFFTKPAYCKNEAPTQLNGSVLPGGVIRPGRGHFKQAKGLNDSLGVFDPTIADTGKTAITYILTDQFGCEYPYTDTVLVRKPPQILMTLDGSRTNTSFCGSTTHVDIRSTLVSGNAIDSIRYFGAGVIDSTLNPNSVFVNPGGPLAGTGGTFPIWSVVTDSFGCKGYDTLTVRVIPAPVIDIDSLFNKRTTTVNLGNGNTFISEHTYCKSHPLFLIDGNPVHRKNGRARGTISGKGVKLIDTTYYYVPSQVPTGTTRDTVLYTYEDDIGCTNTDMAIIKLDSVPVVKLSGFNDSSYCPNSPIVQLIGTPDTSLGKRGTFYGPGVNNNRRLFNPALAGIGVKSIIYEFVDNNLCINTDTAQITVHQLPIPKFDGYLNQYCTAGADDTLRSLNSPVRSSYKFSGSIIIDTIGILRPSADTANNSTNTRAKTVYYAYTDSMNCTNVDSVNIFIHPTPKIVISGLDSAYCFSDREDLISVFPSGTLYNNDLGFSSSANTITFDPDEDSAGVKTFTYRHRDNNGCADTVTARTYVYKPQSPTIANLDSFYCETNDTISIMGTPIGGNFTGSGIWSDTTNSSWSFIPTKAGIGTHTVIYSIADTLRGRTFVNNTHLVCPADTALNITVRPLPLPKMLRPANNSRFCSNDTLQQLVPATYTNITWNTFRDTSRGIVIRVTSRYDTVNRNPLTVITYPDTTYYFDPGAVVEGTHLISYIATNSSGCQNSIQFTFIVDKYQEPFFSIDTTYCESADSVLLFGIPGGGSFTRNGTPILGTPPYFHPNPGYSRGQYLTVPRTDIITYTSVDGACEGIDTQRVTINPVPQIRFTTSQAHNTYCLGDETVPLTANPTNIRGVFTGNGVLFGTTAFIPNIAGAGSHPIYFNYTDSATMCSSEFIDTLHVYGMPHIDFEVEGGCQHDTIYFKPNNRILGLGNTAQNRIVDSITSIKWVFSPSYSTAGTSHSNQVDSNVIDTMTYVYDTAGVYNTQLIVANRFHCIDTQTVRLVISPKVSSYPYEQDFESSNGDWFAESRDSSHRLLWEWGVDNNNRGIAADAANHIWATQTNASYRKGEDAWVYSPCFDISSLKRPMISLDYWSHTRDQGADGTVLEYQRADGVWAPLGTVGRGTNWFNTPFIPGKPGDQFADDLIGTGWTAPLGWSGINTGWQNGRYKLDAFRGRQNTLRLRMAFASTNIPLNDFYDGFAFDNVIIRDRTRNVLLETMAHDAYSDMENINNHSYQLIHHTLLNKDVVLLQYHIESADGINTTGGSKDAFYLHNPSLGRTRAYEYNSSPAGRGFIDGLDSTYTTRHLSAVDFEQDMLATPKFSIAIDTFSHINGNFKIVARVKALQAMPTADYRIYTVISEDSLNYPNGSSYTSQIHAVVRENDQHHLDNSHSPNIFHQYSWANDEVKRVEFNWNHTSSGFINYRPKPFQAIVFIQNITTKEIFQVASTRDVSGYWIDTTDISVDQVQVANELQEIQGMTLFPNPAHDYFHLKFEQALKQEYQWRLVDMRGVEVQQGNVAVGTEQLLIEGLQHPPGTYILLLHNKHVFVQRKVILGRP